MCGVAPTAMAHPAAPRELAICHPLQFALRLSMPLLLGSLMAQSARAQTAAGGLTIIGEHGVSKSLTMAELAALPQADVVVREPDSSTLVFRGPTLRSLVTLVGAPTGHALRGPAMLLAVVAEAADGYRVGYMLADLDEQFGARKAILALTQDGHALPARDGPLRIVVAGEEHHARWIRQVLRLRLVRVGPGWEGRPPDRPLELAGDRVTSAEAVLALTGALVIPPSVSSAA